MIDINGMADVILTVSRYNEAMAFYARPSREDVDKIDALLREMDAHIVTPASEGHWAPGYYYVLFADPDGIRLEVNHVPGQGVLAENTSFNPGNNW